MANSNLCIWHLKDTRWREDADPGVVIHSLVIDLTEYEFCIIDYTVNSLNGYKHEWTEENIKKAIDFCKPILKAMDVKKRKLTIQGIEFPKTNFEI